MNPEENKLYPCPKIDRTGRQPATSGLIDWAIEASETGKVAVWPQGATFRVERQGSDAGGIKLKLAHSLTMRAEPGCRLIADDLDNTMIDIRVKPDQPEIDLDLALPFLDMRGQRNSQKIPYRRKYKPTNAGDSMVCDGIDIRGESRDNHGYPYFGINRCIVRSPMGIAGTDWRKAGGDSFIFIGGCREQIVIDPIGRGFRDQSIYLSDDPTGTLGSKSLVIGGRLRDACFGSWQKRGGSLRIVGTEFLDVHGPFGCHPANVTDARFSSIEVHHVAISGGNYPGRFYGADHVVIGDSVRVQDAQKDWFFDSRCKHVEVGA